MCLQKIHKTALLAFDNERCFYMNLKVYHGIDVCETNSWRRQLFLCCRNFLALLSKKSLRKN